MVFEAVKVALDPTPTQERLLLSHAGAARFAFNAGLAHVKDALDAGEKPEWSFYSLRKWWNANKDALAVSDDGVIWWHENSKEAYSSGLEALAKGLSNWSKSRRGERRGRKVGFPKFKAKSKAAPRFAYTTGAFGLIQGDPKALKLPKVGRVHCMEDVSERVYRCDACGLVMDRDLNAAVNIKVAGSAPETQNAHGETVKRGDLSDRATLDSVKCEPSRGDNRVRLGVDERKHVLQAKSSSLQRYSTGAW